MTTSIATNEVQWDAFMLAHGGGFLQSWGWSTFQETLGRKVYRLEIDSSEQGGVHAQCVVIMHPLPFGLQYAYIPRGPIMNLQSKSAIEIVTHELRTKLTADSAVFVRVEWPYMSDHSPISSTDLSQWEFVSVKSVQPADTIVMDLTKNEEALLSSMHSKTRYNIRVAERHGVIVKEGNDIDLFWRMLSETAARDKFHTHSQEHYTKMFSALSQNRGDGSLRMKLVFAEYEGKVIAGAIFLEYGDTVTYLHGASVAAHRNVMAPHLLHWTAIREAKRAGFRRYDFWGVAPSDDASHPWAGVTRFKTGFGGAQESMLGAWELSGNRFWYSLYRYAKRFLHP